MRTHRKKTDNLLKAWENTSDRVGTVKAKDFGPNFLDQSHKELRRGYFRY